MNVHHISSEHLSIEKIAEIINSNARIELSDSTVERIKKCRKYLDDKMSSSDKAFYGINTGFGSLCDVQISKEDLSELQSNLVKSHACGMGEEVPQEIVKLMLLLKIQGLSYGHSGVALETVQRLINFYNNDILPIVYQQGSLGASGDLAPLANMSLPLIGEGEAYYKGAKVSAFEVNQRMNWEPLKLQSKEGLALLNGTQFMSAYSTFILIKSLNYSDKIDLISSVSLDGFDCRMSPYSDNVLTIRQQEGQALTGKNIRTNLEGSEIAQQEKVQVQDPYCFRCLPQVHGASKDAIQHVKRIVENEINSVTDNPTIFPDTDEIISAGNFHGQPLAISLDFLAIALAEMGSISERRVYKMLSGERNLPAFLVANPGLNSGFMIVQYSAASIVSQNKQLCTPASVDTIDSSNGQEDHVSMGANAATKCMKVLENLEKLLGIELFTAAQALEFRRPLKSSNAVENLVKDFRKFVPFIADDEVMYKHIEASRQYIINH